MKVKCKLIFKPLQKLKHKIPKQTNKTSKIFVVATIIQSKLNEN